jgi:hypothetical protein
MQGNYARDWYVVEGLVVGSETGNGGCTGKLFGSIQVSQRLCGIVGISKTETRCAES